jgi:hypothetical protein
MVMPPIKSDTFHKPAIFSIGGGRGQFINLWLIIIKLAAGDCHDYGSQIFIYIFNLNKSEWLIVKALIRP